MVTQDNRELLEDFIEWAQSCGEDAFYIFEDTEEAINRFIEQS